MAIMHNKKTQLCMNSQDTRSLSEQSTSALLVEWKYNSKVYQKYWCVELHVIHFMRGYCFKCRYRCDRTNEELNTTLDNASIYPFLPHNHQKPFSSINSFASLLYLQPFPYDTLVQGICGEPICMRTRSSHCRGPFRWISIQHGVLVMVCRL